jgi:hypothetical protein
VSTCNPFSGAAPGGNSKGIAVAAGTGAFAANCATSAGVAIFGALGTGVALGAAALGVVAQQDGRVPCAGCDPWA